MRVFDRWWFIVNRPDGVRRHAVLYTEDQKLPRAEVVSMIRDGIVRMLNAGD